jgi:predicted RNase H-like HicB family nuclease
MHRFLIIIEKAKENFTAYSPDLPGCIATGKTPEETEQNMNISIEMHLEGLKEDRLPIPKPNATTINAMDDVNHNRNLSKTFDSIESLIEDLDA